MTDEIERLTESGIQLKSGDHLGAEIIVSATGLQMLAIGGIELSVDGTKVDIGKSVVYKGTMVGNVPNFAFCVGYTNASWTLRADLASTFVCRTLNYMDRRGYDVCTPLCDFQSMEIRPLLNLNSGYVRRAEANLPKQGAKKPWLVKQNYILDLLTMKLGQINDGTLQFSHCLRIPASTAKSEPEAVGSEHH